MSTATRDGNVIAWPTTPRRTWRQRLTAWRDQTSGPDQQTSATPATAVEHTGADETWTPSDELEPGDTGRHHRGNVIPVDRGYRLSPAALQRVTRTVEQIPSSYEDVTGLLNTPNVPEPAQTRGQVLADIRHAVTTPAEVLDALDRWVDNGCPIDDQTTDTTGEKDQ